MKRNPYILLVAIIVVMLQISACGRDVSRLGGKEHRQILEVPGDFISISFDKNEGSTVKDVTFTAKDGFVYTQEFKDISPLEGILRWVPHGMSSDLIQSRSISRWTGTSVDLELPKDCKKILGVDVGYSSKNERTKNLTYLSTDGNIYSKEYREGIFDRMLEGWLEVKKIQ